MTTKLRGEEEWIRQCMEAAMPGSRVVQHDDGSAPGMHDLDVFVEGGGNVGAVEISAAVDSTALQLWKLITKPGMWTYPELTGGWIVTVSRTARVRDLKNRLPGLLRRLETQGRRQLPRDIFLQADPDLDLDLDLDLEEADDLSVVSAHQGPTDRPGSVYVLVGAPPEQSGGLVPGTADCVVDWLSDWLQREDQKDNLGKLARSGARDRHMVVLVSGTSPAPFDVEWALTSDDTTLPGRDPDLPDEITQCWILSTWAAGYGLRWSSDGWAWFDKLQSRSPRP